MSGFNVTRNDQRRIQNKLHKGNRNRETHLDRSPQYRPIRERLSIRATPCCARRTQVGRPVLLDFRRLLVESALMQDQVRDLARIVLSEGNLRVDNLKE